MWYDNANHPLRSYFSGLTEQTFMADLGVADPQLIDYLSMLLSRFVHIDTIYRLRSESGRRLEEVAEMMLLLCSDKGQSINGTCIPIFGGV